MRTRCILLTILTEVSPETSGKLVDSMIKREYVLVQQHQIRLRQRRLNAPFKIAFSVHLVTWKVCAGISRIYSSKIINSCVERED